MHFSQCAFLFISAYAAGVLCDFLGPTFPAPLDLTSNGSLVPSSWRNLGKTLNDFIGDSNSNLKSLSGLKNLTFSVGMFSTHDPSAAESLQFHHTDSEVAKSSTGVKKVDGNSIYRIASMSKLFTSFAAMLELESSDWDRPITDFVPSLAAYAEANPAAKDLVHTVEWNRVTLAALASQIAGTPRDVSPNDPSDYFTLYYTDFLQEKYGLPALNISDPVAVPPCLVSRVSGNLSCSGDQYALGAAARPPSFLPWASPAYTDFGFMLLGLAIANITSKSIHDVYHDSIYAPLAMSSSFSSVPNATQYSRYVIVGNLTASSLLPETVPEVTIPSGGLLSSTNDLAKLGTAILNSTLLDPDQTRKWMKPVSHTAMMEFSVGKPWEIYRYTHPRTGLVTDIYTKLGDSGHFGGYVILIPDFDAGFSIIGASLLDERSPQIAMLADLVIETMLPVLTAQAEAEAKRNFVGTYTSGDKSLNSTITVAISAKGAPGLVITRFISNGTDVLRSGLIGKSPVRLLHTISDQPNGKMAFRTSSVFSPAGGLFLRQYNVNLDWLAGDSPDYGGVGMGLFVFDIDAVGNSAMVTPAAWRTTLRRVG